MVKLISGQSLQILLVSTQEKLRGEVNKALAGRFSAFRLYWVSQPDLAVARAKDLVPHVILVDDALNGADPIPLIRQLAVTVPSAVVVTLVESGAMSLARQAVLVGARSFVAKPLQADDLASTLWQVLVRQPLPSEEPEVAEGVSGYIIVFCAPKGGTGRTTLAINTAVSLRDMTDEPVVLVDADYAAPALDVALNLHSERNISDLVSRLSQLDKALISDVLVEHVSGVQILLAPPPEDLSSPILLHQVQHILVLLKRMFPWVIVDLGLPLDEMAFAFLDGADCIIMSVLPEMVGLRNTRLMLGQFRRRGYPEKKVRLVLNRATMRGGVSVHDIEERLHMHLQYRIPDDQPLVTYSINRGVPLMMSHPRSAVARAMGKLSQQLAEDFPTGEATEQARGGILTHLLRNIRGGWAGLRAKNQVVEVGDQG